MSAHIESPERPAWAIQSREDLGVTDTLPELIDRLEATVQLRHILSTVELTPDSEQWWMWRATDEVIDLRRMLTHRMQQLEVFEAQGSHARAYLYWSTISRMWVAETEALQ